MVYRRYVITGYTVWYIVLNMDIQYLDIIVINKQQFMVYKVIWEFWDLSYA